MYEENKISQERIKRKQQNCKCVKMYGLSINAEFNVPVTTPLLTVTPYYVLCTSVSCKAVSLSSGSLSFLLDFEFDFQIILIIFKLSQDIGMFLLEPSRTSFFFFSVRFASISV